MKIRLFKYPLANYNYLAKNRKSQWFIYLLKLNKFIVEFLLPGMKLDKVALAWAFAIFDGLIVFLAMAFSLLTGRVSDAMTRVAALHGVSYSWVGALAMAVEHAVVGFALGWFFAWVYNSFVRE